MQLASIPQLNGVPVDQLLRNIRLRGGSERNSARLAADLAIRDRSLALLHVLAAAALPSGGWDDVLRVAQTSPSDLTAVRRDSAPWWAALGRVCAAFASAPEALKLAGDFFDVAMAVDPEGTLNRGDALACAQVYEATDRASQVRDIPVAKGALEEGERELFELNALADSHGPTSDQWLALANQIATEPYGLAPLAITSGDDNPFDRLRAHAQPASQDGPLISIIMTTFQRGETLLTAVRSVQEQTWRNWELLLIDDCSGEEHHALLAQAERLDERIRVIRRDVNEGTYAARNVGIAQAKGEYITFQDDDDWSHPQRLARQVRRLIDDTAVRVTMSYALHFTDSLHVRFGGRRTRVLGSSTLMTRTEDLRKVGGFDLVRKSGDTELIRRLDAIAPQGRVVLPEPLAFMRLTDGSLSRSDFGPGWVHPARSEYAEASMSWHTQFIPGVYESARVSPTRSFPAPDAMLSPALRKPRQFDVVIAGDFSEQSFHASATALIFESAVSSGANVGLIQLDTPNRPQPSRRSFIAEDVRRHIDGETVRRILPKDVATTPVIVFSSPETTQFMDRAPWDVTASTSVLVCDSSPSELSDTALWNLEDCLAAMTAVMGETSVRLLAHDEHLAEQLSGLNSDTYVEVLPLATGVFTPAIAGPPMGQVSVIGRVGSHDPAHWEAKRENLVAAYPLDGTVDVRFLGDISPVKQLLESPTHGWLNFPGHELSVPLFIQQLDVYVAAGGRAVTLPETRIIHAALVSGRPVVIARGTEHPFDDAVVTCDVGQVAAEVQRLVTDPDYRAQQQSRTSRWLAEQDAPTNALQVVMGVHTTGADPSARGPRGEQAL